MVPPGDAGAPAMRPSLHVRNRFLLLGDVILIVTSVLASFALRLDLGPLFLDYVPHMWTMVGVALLVKPFVYYLFGMYRRYWVYASARELLLVAIATATASIGVALIIMLVIPIGWLPARFPRSVLGIDWLLSLFSAGGLRMAIRVLAESGQVSQKFDGLGRMRRVVIVGAGDAGALVVREMQRNPQLHMLPLAFVDDDPEKLRKDIHGIRVSGRLTELAGVIERYRADEVVIAIPTATGRVVRQVTDTCRQKSVPFRTMPGIYELIGGKVSVNRLREVDIGDLLRRETAHIDEDRVAGLFSGKRVLITGAGGSIGLELCRQISRWQPAQLGLLGHGENSVFEALIELNETFPGLPVLPIIADIRDQARMHDVFDAFRPDIVFHAAAHKHVPLMELNIEEAVTNNVLGTQTVVNAALSQATPRLVLISTDKAVEPASIYGATKRVAEMIVRDAAMRSGRAFSTVRFGNVLGSRGSIVPLFKRQIARGGPVTITHPDMKRFFMTIPEAVHLVLQAAVMGQGGEVFVLRMGEPVRIVDLAEDLIRLSGLEPGKEVEIAFTGVRPGDKLSESLWEEGMPYESTAHPDIIQVSEEAVVDREALEALVGELLRLAREGDGESLIGLMNERVPGSAVGKAPPPDLTAVL